MIYNNKKYTQSMLSWFVGISAALFATGCANDNPFADTPADDTVVRFSVAMQGGSASSYSRGGGVFSLKGSDATDSLSVMVTVADGIGSGETMSRGAAVTKQDFHSSIGILAYMGRDPWDDATSQCGFMYDEEVTAVSGWTTEHNWPGSQFFVRFFAYAPYQAEGVTLTPSSTPGLPVLSYTVPGEVEKQSDLVTAYTEDMPGGNQPSAALKFDHQLTAVRFLSHEIQNGGTIVSITLKNVYSSGDCAWGGDWTNLGNLTDFSIAADFDTDGSTGQMINDGVTTFMMMPQTLPADAAIEVVYTDQNGVSHTLSASIGGSEWPKGKTVTYRISYSNISIVPPLRNVDSDATIISNGSHDLKLDFSNSDFEEMEVRVYKRLVTTDLKEHAEAYALNQGVSKLSGDGFGANDYGQVLVDSKQLVSGADTQVEFSLGENTDENMLWQVVVQYRLPNSDGSQTEWTDAGTRLYQDAKPVEGQDWIFYYDDSQPWTTPYHGEIIYKSTYLMKNRQTAPEAIGGLEGEVWWQCDHATNEELRDNITSYPSTVRNAFQTANKTGAINIPQNMVDYHYVSGTFGASRFIDYVPGEASATAFRSDGAEMGGSPTTKYRAAWNIGTKAMVTGRVNHYRLLSPIGPLTFKVKPQKVPLYERGSTTEISKTWMTVVPTASPVESNTNMCIDAKILFVGTYATGQYVESGMILSLDRLDDRRAFVYDGNMDATVPLLCGNKTANRYLGTFKADANGNNAYQLTSGQCYWTEYDKQPGWGYWTAGEVFRASEVQLTIWFEPVTGIDMVYVNGTETPYNQNDRAINWEEHETYTLTVDEEDTNIWVRKPYEGGTVAGFAPQN